MTVVINGSTGIDTLQDGIVTDAKLSLSANSQEIKDALNAGGSAPIYACRAWVNFNGTGTVAIRASGNVSSITDRGTGEYTINFITSMPDVNYTVAACGTSGSNYQAAIDDVSLSPQANGVRVKTQTGSSTPNDTLYGLFSIFR